MSELVVEPFVNEFGQVINPGDEIIFVGTSWKQTQIRKGVFGGVHYDMKYNSRDMKDADGNVVMETTPWGVTRQKRENYLERGVVSVRVEKVNRGPKWGYVDNPETGKREYKKTGEIDYGISTLPLKRVYRMDTSLVDMTGKYF
jgi:hypothetical protein